MSSESTPHCVNKETESVFSEPAPRGHFSPVTSTFQLRGLFPEVDKSRHLLVLLTACKDFFLNGALQLKVGGAAARSQSPSPLRTHERASTHSWFSHNQGKSCEARRVTAQIPLLVVEQPTEAQPKPVC